MNGLRCDSLQLLFELRRYQIARWTTAVALVFGVQSQLLEYRRQLLRTDTANLVMYGTQSARTSIILGSCSNTVQACR